MAKLLVRDLMTARVRAVHPDDDLQRLHLLMDEMNVRHMPVVDDDGSLAGLVSQRDLLRSALLEPDDMPMSMQQDLLTRVKVKEVMTSEVEAVAPDTPIVEAARAMWEFKYGCLPVVEDTRLVGILTEADFVRYLAGGVATGRRTDRPSTAPARGKRSPVAKAKAAKRPVPAMASRRAKAGRKRGR